MEHTKPIKILTHNLQCHYFVVAPNKWQRMQKFLDNIESYDILLLQELFTVSFFGHTITSIKDWLIEQSKTKGFLYHSVPEAAWFGQDSGLLILSKYPITSCKHIVFRNYSHSERINAKGAARATIEISDTQKLHVITAHLDSKGQQFNQFQEIKKQLFDGIETDPAILTGDLNISLPSSKYPDMLQTLLPFEDTFNGLERHGTFRGYPMMEYVFPKPWVLDYVFANNIFNDIYEITERNEVDIEVSDHIGLSITFQKRSASSPKKTNHVKLEYVD